MQNGAGGGLMKTEEIKILPRRARSIVFSYCGTTYTAKTAAKKLNTTTKTVIHRLHRYQAGKMTAKEVFNPLPSHKYNYSNKNMKPVASRSRVSLDDYMLKEGTRDRDLFEKYYQPTPLEIKRNAANAKRV